MSLSELQIEEFLELSGRIYATSARLTYADDSVQHFMLKKYPNLKPDDFKEVRGREAQDVNKTSSKAILDDVERRR